MNNTRLRTSVLPTLLASALVVGSGSLLAYGCSAGAATSASANNNTGGEDGQGGSGGSPSTGGSKPTGSVTNASTTEAASGVFIDAGKEAGLDEDAACTGQSVEAQLVPLDMVILLDRSGSMDTNNKWDKARTAMKDFVADPSSAGISVGLNYFPVEDDDDCNFEYYKTLDVPVGELPGNKSAIDSSLTATDTTGGTPSYGAMKGTLFHATKLQDDNPTHKVVQVFISDGEPIGCSEELDADVSAGGLADDDHEAALATIAEKALLYNGVQTYVLVVPGVDASVLDPIAKAGGTGQAIDISSDISQFAAAMKEIREAALSCEFTIPPPPEGEELDPDKVNVRFTDKDGNVFKYPRVPGPESCFDKPGWYYDSELDPKKILLCPASCEEVKSDKDGKFEVQFGCKSDIF